MKSNTRGRSTGYSTPRNALRAASVQYDKQTRSITVSVPVEVASASPSGQIQLYRPSALNQDRTIKLELTAQGVTNH